LQIWPWVAHALLQFCPREPKYHSPLLGGGGASGGSEGELGGESGGGAEGPGQLHTAQPTRLSQQTHLEISLLVQFMAATPLWAL
jgi:hypothetical protein